MYIALLVLGSILALVGSLLFLIDAFRVHWGWGLGALFFPPANIVCLIKHWTATKRGFLISLLALPFLAGGLVLLPKTGGLKVASQPEKVNDPFFNAIQKARAAMVKVEKSREEGGPANPNPAASAPTVSAPAASVPTVDQTPPTPPATLVQRLANNRAAFKSLETEFAELARKRQALPKNDSKAIAAFNLDAKAYADKLSATRSEQAILLELERTAVTKK